MMQIFLSHSARNYECIQSLIPSITYVNIVLDLHLLPREMQVRSFQKYPLSVENHLALLNRTVRGTCWISSHLHSRGIKLCEI